MRVPETEIIASEKGVESWRKIVGPGEYVIGRDGGSDLSLPLELVSARHALLTVNYDHAVIEDLGSSNGTYVNGEAVTQPTRLWPNQKIQIGSATLELRRLKFEAGEDQTLAPQTAAVRKLLPEEFLREKKYEVGKVIGQGGMGAVLSAREATTERTVAMKVMLDESSVDGMARFVREARVTAQLEHPNIVPVHELNVDENDQIFYTMKMVRGMTFKSVLDALRAKEPAAVRRYSLPALLTIFQKVCDAVAFAHSKGVIHRDLKPENIMLGDFGEVLVMDWGLAKVAGEPAAAQGESDFRSAAPVGRGEAAGSGTMEGVVVGTPHYMSPEQARGEVDRLDARSDVFSLGAILYEILTLRRPFTGGTMEELVEAVRACQVTAPSAALKVDGEGGVKRNQALPHLPGHRIPEALSAVTMKAMAANPEARYEGVSKLQADIAAYQSGFATSAEKAGLVRQVILLTGRHKAAATAAALVLLVGGVALVNVVLAGRRAEAALSRLRGTAPTFYEQARTLVEAGKFDEALGKLQFATDLAPHEGRYWLLRGHILQTQFHWSEAEQSLQAALANGVSGSEAEEAKANLALCEKLGAQNGPGTPKKEDLRELYVALLAQHRGAEALSLASYGISADDIGKVYVERIIAVYGEPYGNRLSQEANGTFTFQPIYTPGEKPINDLRPLMGIPISKLIARDHPISDLSPLEKAPLAVVDINRTKVRDLAPLRGKQLVELNVGNTDVDDLSPLAGMPLRNLDIGHTKVTDLGALHGMPLRDLSLNGLSIRDFAPLRGLPLERIAAGEMPFSDLEVLKEMPLRDVTLNGIAVKSLAPLATLKLEHIDAFELATPDLKPLHGMPLKSLNLIGAKGPLDLSELSGLPLEELELSRANIQNLSGLTGMPLKRLAVSHTDVEDLGPLRGLPLESLHCEDTKATDISALLDCPTLTDLVVPAAVKNVALLRKLPNLKRLSYHGAGVWRADMTVVEFWNQLDGVSRYPTRAPGTPGSALDLEQYYTDRLDDDPTDDTGDYRLSTLPRGVQTFDGVAFDVRGLLILACPTLPVEKQAHPAVVNGIPINRRVARLHFLQASAYSGGLKDGKPIARYALHYADGGVKELPVKYGEDLREWAVAVDTRGSPKYADEIWRGAPGKAELRLFHRAYDNPRPEMEITTLDLVSEQVAAPIIVAISME